MRYMRSPKPATAFCGLARQRDCFVSTEFGSSRTSRNPGKRFHNAMWLPYSRCQMAVYGWAIPMEESASSKMGP